MRYIDLESTDPAYNHAAEEYFLKQAGAEYFLLWRNTPCVLLGKNQNAYAEVNLGYAAKNDIAVVRRITGGGAVYNDLGNLNFAYILNKTAGMEPVFASFGAFTKPIIRALRALGIDAELTGRNDLTAGGKKISGNAQARLENRILHHGTLLYSVNMAELSSVLKTRAVKFQGKSVQSVKARVANIRDLLTEPMPVDNFRSRFLANLTENDPAAVRYVPTERDENAIRQIADEKYRTWEWNIGRSPGCTFRCEMKFPGGLLQAHFDLENGKFHKIKFYGDFFSEKDISGLESGLEGTPCGRAELERRLSSVPVGEYCTNITPGQICELLLGCADSGEHQERTR